MMVRLLVFCLHAEEGLEFAGGLSVSDEPAMWLRSLDGRIRSWIEVGEPGADRVQKACRMAESVQVYSFNSKSDTWWQRESAGIGATGAKVFQLPWAEVEQLAELARRTLAMSVTVSDLSALVATESGSVELTWRELSA